MSKKKRRGFAPKPPLGPSQLRSITDVQNELKETPRQDMAPLLTELATLRLLEAARMLSTAASDISIGAQAAAQTAAQASYVARISKWNARKRKA